MHGIRMHYRLKNQVLPLLAGKIDRWQWVSETYGILWCTTLGDANSALSEAQRSWDSKSLEPYMV